MSLYIKIHTFYNGISYPIGRNNDENVHDLVLTRFIPPPLLYINLRRKSRVKFATTKKCKNDFDIKKVVYLVF